MQPGKPEIPDNHVRDHHGYLPVVLLDLFRALAGAGTESEVLQLVDSASRRLAGAEISLEEAELGSANGADAATAGAPGWRVLWKVPRPAAPSEALGASPECLVATGAGTPTTAQRQRVELLLRVAAMAVSELRMRSSARLAVDASRSAPRDPGRGADDQRQLDVLAAASSMQEIVSALSTLTGRQAFMRDFEGRVLVRSAPAPSDRGGGRPDVGELFSELDRHPARRAVRWRDRIAALVEPEGGARLVLYVLDPSPAALGPPAADEVLAATILKLAVPLVEREVIRLQSGDRSDARLERRLVEEIIIGSDFPNIALRSGLLGHDLDAPGRVAVVQSEGGGANPDALVEACRRASRLVGMDALVGERHGRAVLVGADDPEMWARLQAAMADQVRDGHVHVGIGGLCAGPADYPKSYHEAEQALVLQRNLAIDRGVVRFDDLGVLRLFADLADLSELREFILRWLGPLIEYDREKGSDLVTTLDHYLEAGGNYDLAAQSLILHRSTLRYRLQRIRQVGHLELNDPDTRFNLQLATRALKTVTSLGFGGEIVKRAG